MIPDEIPKIWVCTAPATAVLQTSELFTTTLGEFAVGGVLFVTTVLLTVFVSAFALVTVVTTNIKVKTTTPERDLQPVNCQSAPEDSNTDIIISSSNHYHWFFSNDSSANADVEELWNSGSISMSIAASDAGDGSKHLRINVHRQLGPQGTGAEQNPQ